MGPPTPEWALWGNGGFDPADERVYRKGKNKGGTVEAVAGVDAEGVTEEGPKAQDT
ncbi:MAG: hypothetical protein M1830_005320 [Pleopsidium flavum]|nr:MAG: hypothetical protein M1830_005320 [Pleopsidium flavum]